MRELLEEIVKGLVSHPDQVEVKESDGDKSTIFEAKVAKEDMGKVIGRKGKTIESIKIIVGACGAKHKKRYMFQILDEEEDQHQEDRQQD